MKCYYLLSSMEFDCLLTTTDWIFNILWMKSTLLLTISAHNVATIWCYNNKTAINSSSCDERCILYPYILLSLKFNYENNINIYI